jgi:hypothetical protein
MNDDPLDPRLREAAQAYNAPPQTPRDELWARIQAAREGAPVNATAPQQPAPRVLPFRPRRTWFAAAAAAAAELANGIGIGRVSVEPETARLREPVANPTTYRLAAQEHLSQSEAFLTLFRTSLEQRSNQRLASASARQLLATNRLLLDSPAASDPKIRLLLEDLELVLAEIAQLSPRSRAEDLQLIRDGIERGNVMPRLRTAVPPGTAPIQGVL